MTRKITRTDWDSFDMGGLAHAPTFPGTPEFSGFVEGQERRGQQELVQSEQFPTDAPIADLEALGFTFGPVDERDPLFRPATLPEGWSRRGTEHAMHSEILDEKGRKRVGIFYKAAFYDRRATAHLIGPHMRLVDLLYADEEPTEVVLDDLLTADMARGYLASEVEQAEDDIELMRGSGRDTARWERRLERTRLVQRLVEKAAGGPS